MKRILLRGTKDPFDVATPQATLERKLIADNSGNLVFLEAAYKLLSTPGTEVVVDHLRIEPRDADRINAEFDAYVLPFANAFRLTYDVWMVRMTELLKRLRIPVVILGIGAQANLDYKLDRLRPIEPTAKAFVRAILDHGPSIGVRGELTETYVRSLGFSDVDVIGCPSMFLWGDRLRIEKRRPRLERDARIAMNVSPYVRRMGAIVMANLERYPNLTYVAQDRDTLELLVWGEGRSEAAETSDVPIHLSHPLFEEDRTRLYIDPWPWLADLRAADFAFGTRIHGNITALLAGTPAYVLAHDSRTLELARYFDIPHRTIPNVPPDVDAATLYDEADYGWLNDGHAARFAVFTEYLHRHGLEHAFEAGGAAEFDARIAHLAFPPALRVSTREADPGSARARLQRLRYRIFRLRRTREVRWLRSAVVRRTRWLARATPRSLFGRGLRS